LFKKEKEKKNMSFMGMISSDFLFPYLDLLFLIAHHLKIKKERVCGKVLK